MYLGPRRRHRWPTSQRNGRLIFGSEFPGRCPPTLRCVICQLGDVADYTRQLTEALHPREVVTGSLPAVGSYTGHTFTDRDLLNSGNGYTYDADGNRVKKMVTPTGGGGAVVTRYLVEDRNLTGYAQVMEERDDESVTTVLYVYGLDLISQKRGSTVRY